MYKNKLLKIRLILIDKDVEVIIRNYSLKTEKPTEKNQTPMFNNTLREEMFYLIYSMQYSKLISNNNQIKKLIL